MEDPARGVGPLRKERPSLFLGPKWVKGACDSTLAAEALSVAVTGPWW